MNFDAYNLDSNIYDEMFLSDGAPREHCRLLYETLRRLSAEELVSIQERVTRLFSSEGITFTVYGDGAPDERIIPIDCLPRILSGAEWRQLETGLIQRLDVLNRFLEDIYNEAHIIADGVIPVDMVRGCPQYRIEMRGVSAPHGIWVAICGTDLVRTNDGFRVLEDNLRVPSGVSYMVANRKAVKTALRRLYRSSRVQEVEHYGHMLLKTLRELAPRGRSDPCIALLTPGAYNSAFYEHMFLAHEIGAELVEGRMPAAGTWLGRLRPSQPECRRRTVRANRAGPRLPGRVSNPGHLPGRRENPARGGCPSSRLLGVRRLNNRQGFSEISHRHPESGFDAVQAEAER